MVEAQKQEREQARGEAEVSDGDGQVGSEESVD